MDHFERSLCWSMVEHLRSADSVFPATAPAANPVFFRTYSRQTPSGRESWAEVCDRTLKGLMALGKLTPEEADLIYEQQRSLKALTSGRWLWIGGTPWIEMPENFSGGYNCTSTNVTDWRAFGLMMNLAMMGCGTGAVLEPHYLAQLPPICNILKVTIVAGVGTVPRNPHSHQRILPCIIPWPPSVPPGDFCQGRSLAALQIGPSTLFGVAKTFLISP